MTVTRFTTAKGKEQLLSNVANARLQAGADFLRFTLILILMQKS